MDSRIKVVQDHKRGCGWRTKKSSLYFRSDGLSMGCGRLPIELEVCPCCGRGIKQSRQFQWVEADEIIRQAEHTPCKTPDACGFCPIGRALNGGELGRAGLIWVGEMHYPTPEDYVEESRKYGVSRRINMDQVPRGFEIGKTWILLAHSKAIVKAEFGQPVEYKGGIFSMFKPDRIEVICDGTETEEEVDRYLERGLTPVFVERVEDTQIEMEFID